MLAGSGMCVSCLTKPATGVQTSVLASPARFPDDLNDILQPGREYPSPTVPGQFESVVAWQWLLHQNQSFQTGEGLASGSSWWSRLVPAYHVCTRPGAQFAFVALASARRVYCTLYSHLLYPACPPGITFCGEGFVADLAATPLVRVGIARRIRG